MYLFILKNFTPSRTVYPQYLTKILLIKQNGAERESKIFSGQVPSNGLLNPVALPMLRVNSFPSATNHLKIVTIKQEKICFLFIIITTRMLKFQQESVYGWEEVMNCFKTPTVILEIFQQLLLTTYHSGLSQVALLAIKFL